MPEAGWPSRNRLPAQPKRGVVPNVTEHGLSRNKNWRLVLESLAEADPGS
jgi:hypothetical protein